jgi:hypothetical protein
MLQPPPPNVMLIQDVFGIQLLPPLFVLLMLVLVPSPPQLHVV